MNMLNFFTSGYTYITQSFMGQIERKRRWVPWWPNGLDSAAAQVQSLVGGTEIMQAVWYSKKKKKEGGIIPLEFHYIPKYLF